MEAFDRRQAFHCLWPLAQSLLLRQTHVGQPERPPLLPYTLITQRNTLVHMFCMLVWRAYLISPYSIKTRGQSQRLLLATTALKRAKIGGAHSLHLISSTCVCRSLSTSLKSFGRWSFYNKHWELSKHQQHKLSGYVMALSINKVY